MQLLSYISEGLDALDSLDEEEKLGLLQQMQEAVIYIGNTIEATQQNAEQMIAILTDFAERIYELSINQPVLEKAKEECNSLRKTLESKIIVKYEILFLPYKSSMWDSLESIYMAAMEDVDCHVTVMPIPYYNVSADRESLEENYEGLAFPQGVQIADYREYSIPEMLPDVIFIHNPYDDANRVTQVNPVFFSAELKKYTDRLVYVPYKVCGEKVKDMFCVLPGVKNAWRVFVQSESVRDVYTKYQPSEKIVVTGSPKIDKVIYNEMKKPAIPKEWEDALAGRKVFLLNTHLDNIINRPAEMLDALKNILDVFEERDDVALLWRPHPLSIETMKALSPSSLKEYLSVIETCKKLKNAVYDESPEPHCAIAISDAYIGDWSSMVLLFGVVGKPVYIRDIEMCQKAMDETSFYKTKTFKSVYYEEILGIKEYIDLICKDQDVRKVLRKPEFEKIFYRTDGQSGKTIWQYVKNDLRESL